MSFINSAVQGLTPPPFVNPQLDEYEGTQYTWRFFVFRPALFHKEVLILIGTFFYVAFIYLGKYYNARRANKWFDAHLPLLSAQFSSPTTAGLNQDGASDFFNYSTGRRGVQRLHTTLQFRPRHDPVQLAYQAARALVDLQYAPRDTLELDFKLAPAPGVPGFVWAVVAKDEMSAVKVERWDLTWTKSPLDNAQLPQRLSVMSEFADITDNLLSSKYPLAKALADPKLLPYFRSLSISDQPRERPTTGPIAPEDRFTWVTLILTVPPASDAEATMPFIKSLFAFIDVLPKATSGLRPETKTKLRKAREELDRELKDELVREKREEQAEEKAAAKKRAEDERISRLSAADQKKALERERKRLMKRSQGKVVKK